MPQFKKKRKLNLQGIIMVVDKLYHRSDPLDCVVWYFIFNLILSGTYVELFVLPILPLHGRSIMATNAMTDCVCFLATISKRMPWVHTPHCWEEEAGVNFIFGSHHSSIVLCKELVCICLQDNNCLQPRTQVEMVTWDLSYVSWKKVAVVYSRLQGTAADS